jgi:hypothetical protein
MERPQVKIAKFEKPRIQAVGESSGGFSRVSPGIIRKFGPNMTIASSSTKLILVKV